MGFILLEFTKSDLPKYWSGLQWKSFSDREMEMPYVWHKLQAVTSKQIDLQAEELRFSNPGTIKLAFWCINDCSPQVEELYRELVGRREIVVTP